MKGRTVIAGMLSAAILFGLAGRVPAGADDPVAAPAPAPAPAPGDDGFRVKISPRLAYQDVKHNGKTVRLKRNQDTSAMVDLDFATTSRPCPPFCIQPMQLGSGIETVGELEVIDYLRRRSQGDEGVMVIDSRTPDWLPRGMIPGAVSIPWIELHYEHTDQDKLMQILEFQFGVVRHGNLLNFENAKTLVLYCNGNWCGQSPTSIRSLRMLGYPAEKIKWYRGGMQAWKFLGLTTVKPSGEIVDGE